MLDSHRKILSEARNQHFLSISKMSADDVSHIWKTVSNYVELQMLARRGVSIPSLGSFTFILNKLDIGNNKQVVIQRPVFLLSEKFSQLHGLKYTKYHTTGEIVVSSLNYTVLALQAQVDRDVFESCVREMLQALSRAVANSKKLEFLFHGVGILSIKNEKVKMVFFKDFVTSLDNSKVLLKTMKNRPNTADSVMTTQSSLSALHRPGTKTLILPRLNEAKDFLPPILEDEISNNDKHALPRSRMLSREFIKLHTVEGVGSEHIYTTANDKDKATNFSSTNKSVSQKEVTQQSDETISTKPIQDLTEKARSVSSELKRPHPPSIKCADCSSSRFHSPKHNHLSEKKLCCLCEYRSVRNIPLSFEEENKKEKDALLMHYQQSKDEEAMLIEEATKNAIRQENEKVAAFNLGVAETVKESKKSKSKEFVKSYVFQHRPLTPLRFYKQAKYNKVLGEQVKVRRSLDDQEKFDEMFQERLEQVQLAEDLATQRDEFVRAKAEHIAEYRHALSAQIRGKALPLPKYESDSKVPVFGRYDTNNLKLLEQRERARATMNDHIESIVEKKKNMILEQLRKNKEENEILKNNRDEMLSDRRKESRRLLVERKFLEKCWREHHLSKVKKDENRKLEMNDPGLLLLHKIDQFRRCDQCQRSLKNCGESNLWSESRFIAGSRIMV